MRVAGTGTYLYRDVLGAADDERCASQLVRSTVLALGKRNLSAGRYGGRRDRHSGARRHDKESGNPAIPRRHPVDFAERTGLDRRSRRPRIRYRRFVRPPADNARHRLGTPARPTQNACFIGRRRKRRGQLALWVLPLVFRKPQSERTERSIAKVRDSAGQRHSLLSSARSL